MLKSADTNFALGAAQMGAAEVRFGRLAMDRGHDPAVKALGEQMVKDHSRLNDQLRVIVNREGLTIPDNLAAGDEATYERLKGLPGTDFDHAFLKRMASHHSKAARAFDKESKRGKDKQLQEFAAGGLPIWHAHLEKMKVIHSALASQKATSS